MSSFIVLNNYDQYGLVSRVGKLRRQQNTQYKKNKPDQEKCNFCQGKDGDTTDHVVSVQRCLKCVDAGII